MKKSVKLLLVISILMLMNLIIPTCSFADENEKTCVQIGMVANDTSAGSSNYQLLCQELNAGTKILVDNKYYLTGPSSQTTINKNISMVGVTDNAEFSFTNKSGTKYLFNIEAKEVIVKKLRLTQLFDGYIHVFIVKNSQKIDNFIMEQNYIEGNIRLLTWSLKNDSQKEFIDPTLTDFGISHFSFNNNTCRNLKQEYNGFIYLNDVPIAHAEIIGNDIKNFVDIFYNHGITNENPYAGEVAKRMSYLEVKDNTVTSDNSWDGAASDSMYHCFVFYEGDKCDYFNNHIEGLHVIDKNTVVYDAYLSCTNLDYEYNYWKNNISFSPTKSNAELMKSKMANTSEYHGRNRVYKNNTYIVEKSYADAFNRPYDELWVSLSGYQHEMDKVLVDSNIIDVYSLAMFYGQSIHNYTFTNNKIHAYKTKEDCHECILPLFLLEKPSQDDAYIVKHNNIIFDAPSAPTDKQRSLIIVSGKSTELKKGKIVFEENHIQWPDLKSIIGTPPKQIATKISNVSIVNNSINTSGSGLQSGKKLDAGLDLYCSSLTFQNNNLLNPGI